MDGGLEIFAKTISEYLEKTVNCKNCKMKVDDGKNCLDKHFENNFDGKLSLLNSIFENINGKTSADIENLQRFRLQKCCSGYAREGALKFSFHITDSNGVDIVVCKKCFQNAYLISNYRFDKLSSEIKAKNNSFYADAGKSESLDSRPQLSFGEIRDLISNNVINQDGSPIGEVSNELVQACLLYPRSHGKNFCASWIRNFVATDCDQSPVNSTYHVMLKTKSDVYSNYAQDCTRDGFDRESYNSFLEVWNQLFPYLKLKDENNICGGCNICSHTADLRMKVFWNYLF